MVKLRFTMLRWRVTCSVDWASPTPLWDIILNKKYFEVRMYHIVAYPNKRKTAGFELDILRFDILTMHLFPPKLENFYSVFQHKPFTSQIRVYIFSFSFFFFFPAKSLLFPFDTQLERGSHTVKKLPIGHRKKLRQIPWHQADAERPLKGWWALEAPGCRWAWAFGIATGQSSHGVGSLPRLVRWSPYSWPFTSSSRKWLFRQSQRTPQMQIQKGLVRVLL